MSDESRDIIEELSLQLKEERGKNAELQQHISQSSINNPETSNMIQYQLETGELLSRIEHFLKGDKVTVDDEGNEYFETPEDPSLILFNDYGVNSIMSIIGNYIDKNTILSFYNEERIYEILADLGDEMSIFIYCNYEKMGMDTEFKKSRFNTIVLTILHSIESTYRRAIGGKALEETNASRILTQSDILGRGINPLHKTKKKFNPLNPSTW